MNQTTARSRFAEQEKQHRIPSAGFGCGVTFPRGGKVMKRTLLTPNYNPMGHRGLAPLTGRLSSLIVSAVALILFQLWSVSASAQTTTSTIEGIITDANGAVISGAEVKANGSTLSSG